MLEQVGEAGLSIPFVPRPDPVPDLEGDHGGFVILKKNHFETVGQDPFENPIPEPSLCEGNEEKGPEEKKKNSFPPRYVSAM